MFRCLTLSACALLVSTLSAAEFSPEAKQELERLQGKWRIISTERDGVLESHPPEPVQVKVEGDKLLLGDKEVGLSITLLALESKPRLIDISHVETKRVIEGVYELEGDRWRICLNAENEGASERPVDFETKGKLKFVTVILHREK